VWPLPARELYDGDPVAVDPDRFNITYSGKSTVVTTAVERYTKLIREQLRGHSGRIHDA